MRFFISYLKWLWSGNDKDMLEIGKQDREDTENRKIELRRKLIERECRHNIYCKKRGI